MLSSQLAFAQLHREFNNAAKGTEPNSANVVKSLPVAINTTKPEAIQEMSGHQRLCSDNTKQTSGLQLFKYLYRTGTGVSSHTKYLLTSFHHQEKLLCAKSTPSKHLRSPCSDKTAKMIAHPRPFSALQCNQSVQTMFDNYSAMRNSVPIVPCSPPLHGKELWRAMLCSKICNATSSFFLTEKNTHSSGATWQSRYRQN